jgi:hypothetical protein
MHPDHHRKALALARTRRPDIERQAILGLRAGTTEGGILRLRDRLDARGAKPVSLQALPWLGRLRRTPAQGTNGGCNVGNASEAADTTINTPLDRAMRGGNNRPRGGDRKAGRKERERDEKPDKH